MLKLMTAPVWVLPWAVAKLLRARATVRQGRKRIPVRVMPAAAVLPAPPARAAAVVPAAAMRPAHVTIRVVVRREP